MKKEEEEEEEEEEREERVLRREENQTPIRIKRPRVNNFPTHANFPAPTSLSDKKKRTHV